MKNELNLRCIMSKDTVPVTGNGTGDLHAGGHQVRRRDALGTMPANFALVLDRSGSMDGEKMDNVKEAIGYVVDHLSDDDLVSVTIFDDQVETLIPSQPAKNREEIKASSPE